MTEMNRMRGQVRIIGVGNSDLESYIHPIIHSDFDSEIIVRSDGFSDLESYVFVKYGGSLDLESDIIVHSKSDLESSLIIRPHNKMTGIFELVEPSSFKKRYYPIKDAFIRSDIPAMNYGDSQDMFVGSGYYGEIYRSLIQFAPLDLPKIKRIKKAEIVLKVMYSGRPLPIGLYEIDYDSPWEENEVNWLIQPSLRSLITTFLSGTYYGDEIRIDVTSLVRDWHENGRPHNGFLLKALDESNRLFKSYGTKESVLSPYLEVEYFDPTVYSYGRTSVEGSLTVNYHVDLIAQIYVRPSQWDSDLIAELLIVDPTSRDGELIINKPDLVSEIYVPFRDDLSSDLIARQRGEGSQEAEIIVNAPEREGSLYILYREEIEAEITIEKPEFSFIESEIVINAPQREGVVIVRAAGEVDFEASVTVLRYEEIDLDAEIVISAPNLEGDLFIPYYSDLEAEFRSRVYTEADLEASISITINSLESEIIVSRSDKGDLDSEIHVRSGTRADFEASISVRVSKQNDLNSSVIVRRSAENDLVSEGIIKYVVDLESNVTVRSSDEIDLDSNVAVRVEVIEDKEADLLVRVRLVDDLVCYIEISGEDYGYCFIM